MAPRFTSAFILLLVASLGWGQAFGRFGYQQSVDIPGWKVDRTGFVAKDPQAEKIRFPAPSQDWKPTTTTDTEQVVSLNCPPGGPSKLGVNLFGLGFSLYFPKGIDLQVGSTGTPYLSWEQGTVEDGIPTPPSSWLMVSFKNKQPAMVFGFPDTPTSLTVTGGPGAWILKGPKDFKGWVRIALARGLDSQLANTPGALGRLSQDAASHSGFWTNPIPKLLKTSIESDLHSVTATWQFDRAGAVVPAPAMLANLGNYPLTVRSQTKRLPGFNENGPIDVLVGKELSIRFPIKRIPTGRSLAIGIQPSDPIGTVSPIDITSVVELALDSLVAGRDALTRKSAEEAVTEFVSQVSFTPEPWTQQQLPYDSYGHGLDLAAAHALLSQAVTSTSRSTSEANSMLTSVCWRQDWATWQVWTSDETIAQRTGALAALAGAFCPEPERRLAAAMFQAGLCGRRGLDVWRRRKEFITDVPKMIEPLYGVRKGIFGIEGPVEEGESFAASLLSPLRIFTEQAVNLTKRGNDYFLQWSVVDAKPSVMTLANAYPIEATASSNISKLKVEAALGFTELHFVPETSGVCEVKITLPNFGKAPMELVKIPNYREVSR